MIKMRFIPLSKAFDSPVKLKLLRFLCGNYTPMGEREMARVVGVSNASVSRLMRQFEELDLVSPQRFGNVIAWQVNQESFAYQELRKIVSLAPPLEHLVATLRNGLAGLPVKRAVLFGSVSQGKERPGSDIDVFVLARSKEGLRAKLDELNEECLRLYGNPLMAYVLTEKELQHPPNPHLMEEIGRGLAILPRQEGGDFA